MLTRLNQWAKECPDKRAVVTDQQTLTYYELWQAIITDKKLRLEERPQVIHEQHYLKQLIAFLQGLRQNNRPLIAHPNMPDGYQQRIRQDNQKPPTQADFAVLSSGSTGQAKLFWRSLSSWTEMFDYQNQVFGLNADTSLFLHGSFSFTGNLNLALAQLWAGGCIVWTQKPSFKTWLMLWQKEQVSHLYLLPTYLNRILPYLTKANMTATHLLTSSQLMSPDLLQRYYQTFPQLEVIIFYGASELSFITWCNGKDALETAGLVGHPFPGVNISLVDKQIFVETPYAIEGIKQPYSVSDFGDMCSAGLILKGRRDDWVNQQGVKCHLPSLVELIAQASGVKEATALKVGSGLNQAVLLVLVLTENQKLAAIKDFLVSHLSPWQLPKYYLLVDQLPLNDSGKIDRAALLALLPSKGT